MWRDRLFLLPSARTTDPFIFIRYEKAIVAMAKQRVTLEVLSYHATAPAEEAAKLKVNKLTNNENVLSPQQFNSDTAETLNPFEDFFICNLFYLFDNS